MAAHKVKCRYCGKEFDTNIEPYHLLARRYAHMSCYEEYLKKEAQDKKDEKDLESYVIKLFNIQTDFLPNNLKKQINDFKTTYNYTYSGMLKTLHWWFDIKKNSVDESRNSLGIIPYIYKQALQYYYNLYMAKQINIDKDVSKYINPEVEVIYSEPPRKEKYKVSLFNLDEEGE